MKRLMPKCTPEFRKKSKCNMMELPDDVCEYRTPAGYCGYYEWETKWEKKLFKQFDRLGQLEDEAEEREKGCKFCNPDEEFSLYESRLDYYFSISAMSDPKYCPQCGRKLV